MPRPNPPRSLQSEDNLAARIAYERERRGWTYEGTAKRMKEAGCPIQGSAIYKIEKGNPRRRISVDELVAFATVFDFENVSDLLIPIELIEEELALVLIAQIEDSSQVLMTAADEYHRDIERIVRMLGVPESPKRWHALQMVWDRLTRIVEHVRRSNEKNNQELGNLISTIKGAPHGEHPETP